MSSFEDSETIMLIRAILAAKKNSITMGELQNEYFEANGYAVPFKELGFPSLISMIKAVPTKIKIENESSGRPLFSAVIDSAIADLKSLVSGQKSAKKKKSKGGRAPMRRYGSHQPAIAPRFQQYGQPRFQQYGQPRRYESSNTRNYEYSNTRSYESSSNRRNYEPPNTRKPEPPAYNDNDRNSNARSKTPSLMDSIETFSLQGKSQLRKVLSQNFDQTSTNTDTNLWIENAAYYLREHEILIQNFISFNEICMRLIGGDHDKQYKILLDQMRMNYKNIRSKPSQKLEVDKIFVAYNEANENFYRVKIVEISSKTCYCCFVDEGYDDDVPVEDVFDIKSEFLKLKFQTITAKLDGLDEFSDNLFIQKYIQKHLNEKKFVAKRTESNPLKLELFDTKTKISITTKLLKAFQHFCVLKLETDTTWNVFISYFDDRKKLGYVQISDVMRQNNLKQMMFNINQYFSNPDNENRHMINEIKEVVKNGIYCAKFKSDNFWYRIKVLQISPSNNKILVSYMDYGNEDHLSFEDLRGMPTEFEEYKYIPAHAIPVVVTEICNSNLNVTIIDLLDFSNSVEIQVIAKNVANIPYVRIYILESDVESEKTVSENNNNNNNANANNADSDWTDTDDECNFVYNDGSDNFDDEQEPAQIVEQAQEVELEQNNRTYIGDEAQIIEEADDTVEETAQKVEVNVENIHETNVSRQINAVTNELIVKKNALIENFNVALLDKYDLPCISYVYVLCTTDPFDFIITPYDYRDEYIKKTQEMKEFYDNKPECIARNHKWNNVYIAKSENNEYYRVKYLKTVSDETHICYNIDIGNFDAYDTNNIFYIADCFIELPILAISAKLAYVSYDNRGQWSDRCITYFSSSIKSDKVYRANMVKYDVETNMYCIDLFDQTISVSKLLKKNAYACEPDA